MKNIFEVNDDIEILKGDIDIKGMSVTFKIYFIYCTEL